MSNMVTFLEAHDVARELEVTPQSIRHFARKGLLRVSAMTPRGIRLFTPDDVRALKLARQAANGQDGDAQS